MIQTAMMLIFVGAAMLGWMVWPDQAKRLMRARLQAEVGREKEFKLIKQLAAAMHPLHRLLPLRGYELGIDRRLGAAGLRMNALHFLVIQELGAMLGAGLYIYTISLDSSKSFNAGWMILCGMLGAGLPLMWISGRIRGRRETIARDLPEVVDLLALCVGAGADFMSALSRIVREFRDCPVREELAIVLSEVKVGKRRRDALRAFADRVQTPEASTFARTLVQADRMGTGLIDALTVLSEDMRIARYHWAERYAQKAPLKMLLPLVISLISAMLIVAGPIVIQFLRGGVMGLSQSAQKQVAEEAKAGGLEGLQGEGRP